MTLEINLFFLNKFEVTCLLHKYLMAVPILMQIYVFLLMILSEMRLENEGYLINLAMLISMSHGPHGLFTSLRYPYFNFLS